jgi:hypothetical protein
MVRYFLIHEYDFFEQKVRPALAGAWLRRSFGPCRTLCEGILPLANDYARRYCTGGGEPVLASVLSGAPFDRTLWRALVGEVLLYGAADVPFLQVEDETFITFAGGPGEMGSPIRQALSGSRDLNFGPAVYRPEHAGYNNRTDVIRLAEHLKGVDTTSWVNEPGADEEDLNGLAFAREGFASLVALYEESASRGRVVVIESVY